ncbi:MAG: hypothetical protein KF795_17840 [Labilithrix sp.]|nr:hypothetical protein [Labilithrix sp.]
MLPSERPAPPWGATCRVCGLAAAQGAPVLFRAWGVDYAHVACGWLRPDELEPHELAGAELRARAWEWACPSCKGVVVALARPAEGVDLRCPSCAAPSSRRATP